jgi:CRISPR-associated Csx2 family protein
MAHILISVLGKVKNPSFPNYQEATYLFEGDAERTSRFFGLTLCEQIKPDKLVVLGTTGSMWDNLLLETSLSESEDLEEDLLALGEAAQQDQVQQSSLDRLASHLSMALKIECELCLIPYGINEVEQTQTLTTLVNYFQDNDQATLDVTHGLRHLPMLMQQSALLLQTLKNVKIEGIYYGALDLTQKNQGKTPVMLLNGLLSINQWTEALSYYDKSGDYSIFADLLLASGLKQQTVDYLYHAAFYEQTNNISQARGQLRKFVKALDEEESQCKQPALLFLPALKKRFDWIDSHRLYERQAQVARLALKHSDFIRACIYGFEAFITYLVQKTPNANPDKYEHRQQAKENFEKKGGVHPNWKQYKLLRELRNQLAHSSTATTNETQQIMQSRKKMEESISVIFDKLLEDKV